MGLHIGSVVLHVGELGPAREFWARALDYQPHPHNPDFLGPAEGSTPPAVRLHLDGTDRTHLDLWIDGGNGDKEAEADRLVELGATRVEWTYPEDADFVVLADPAGNLFCVIG